MAEAENLEVPAASLRATLVERLRGYDPDFSNAYVVREAADEIERLTRERDEWRDAARRNEDAHERLRVERDDFDGVIADVREILARFDSEDVRVMARRAIEALEGSPDSASGGKHD